MNISMLLGRIKASAKYAVAHFFITLIVAIIVGFLVFFVWYPKPYGEMAGGLGLYKLILIVDVICGPLLTLLLITPVKTRRAIFIDIVVISVIQVSALSYGLYTVSLARPVAMVFENSRFRLVTKSEVDVPSMKLADYPYDYISFLKIREVAIRKVSTQEQQENLAYFLSTGADLGMRPNFWISYDAVKSSIWSDAYPLEDLSNLTIEERKRLSNAIPENVENLRYYPIMAPMSDSWIVLVQENGEIFDYVNVYGW